MYNAGTNWSQDVKNILFYYFLRHHSYSSAHSLCVDCTEYVTIGPYLCKNRGSFPISWVRFLRKIEKLRMSRTNVKDHKIQMSRMQILDIHPQHPFFRKIDSGTFLPSFPRTLSTRAWSRRSRSPPRTPAWRRRPRPTGRRGPRRSRSRELEKGFKRVAN